MHVPCQLQRILAVAIVLICTGSGYGNVAAQGVATPEVSDDLPQPSILFQQAADDQTGAIEVELQPGDEETVSVLIGNNGDVDFEAVTYAADAFTMRNGGFSLHGLDSEPSGATTWLDFPTEVFDTTAGEVIEKDVVISVPENAMPGEYVTGIVMQTTEPVNPEATDGNFRVNQFYRTVIGIRIIVPGEMVPAIEYGEPYFAVEGNVPGVFVPVSNTGNYQVAPAGEFRLTDADGNHLFNSPISLGPIYGGHETEVWFGLSQMLPDGDYTVELTLAQEEMGISAELPPTTFAVTGTEGDTQIAESPITFTTASAEPMPAADNIQFLAVDATITNTTEEPIASAQLSLIATVDGEEVERFPVSQSLSVPPGETEISTRYIPLPGWTSGEWEFELLLETVEGSGAAIVVDRVTIETKVIIP